MPADQLEPQEEHQLVLLEDEVFNFDDVRGQLSQEEPPLKGGDAAAAATIAAAAAPPAHDPQLPEGDAASREARDTREMIESMLDQQPLMSVDTTPSAYLEYLRIIFNCSRLLRQPAMPADLRQSVTPLLAKAKSLFCANAFSLVIQTVNAVGGGGGGGKGGPPMPAFWGETFSQHECQLWIDLIETILFFWSDPDPGGLLARCQDDSVVEAFAVGLLDRLGELRGAYAGPADRQDECGRRVERLASDIERRLRPRHLLALAHVKKADRSMLPALAAFDCFLEAAGGLQASPLTPRLASPTLSRTKAALESVTFGQIRAAVRLHRPAQFPACLPRMQRLRQCHLCRPELREPPRRLRDLLGQGGGPFAKDPELLEFLAAYVEYAAAASEFELRWQRSVVKDAAAIGPFLLERLSSLVAKNIARAKSAGCWESLSDELQDELQQQSDMRLSALTGASGIAIQAEQHNGFVAMELDIAVERPRSLCLQFVLPTTQPVNETVT